MKQLKNIPIVIFFILFVITALAAALPNKETPPKFKNLKVLPKNISEAALDKIMDSYNNALGVNCDFCHAKSVNPDELKFESDTKAEKRMARKMMLMTYDINIKYFGATKDRLAAQRVNCMTCHNKKAYPVEDSVVNFIK
jgi:Photosynthetic reaction centre cytochrome C subunit